MEKKTIGKFITALRKANGMTQKDLAEQLNVSDKTVSRWERDEGAPDLSMIPVLAEIFEVSCDELLKGERKRPNETEVQVSSKKGEKQKQRLLKTSLAKYKNATVISMGIGVAGFLVALIANLAFLKAVLGFLFGAIFYVASVVCQSIFMNKAFLSVEDAEIEETELAAFKNEVIKSAESSFGLTIAFAGFTFPLVLMDAYVGLSADNMLLFGIIGAAIFLVVYAVVLYFVNHSLIQNGKVLLNEKEYKKYMHNHKLQRNCSIVLVTLVVCTMLIHHVMTTIWGPYSIMEGITFTDYDRFIEFMEQDVPHQPYDQFYDGTTGVEEVVGPPDSTIYYDENGNEISEEEFYHRQIKDLDGNVVCEYTARNESVTSISYSPKKGTVLPITVSTDQHLKEAREKAQVRHVIFGFVYGLEVLSTLLIYIKKRAK